MRIFTHYLRKELLTSVNNGSWSTHMYDPDAIDRESSKAHGTDYCSNLMARQNIETYELFSVSRLSKPREALLHSTERAR